MILLSLYLTWRLVKKHPSSSMAYKRREVFRRWLKLQIYKQEVTILRLNGWVNI